jgi:Recombination endonuclease VII
MSNGYFRPYCSKCRAKMEALEFCSRCGKKRDGSHATYCRECYQAYSREHYARNVEHKRAKTRNQHIKSIYGMSVAEWNAKLVEQGGKCAVCYTEEPGGRGQFHTDHDHVTGKVRGLLCTRCNVALGMVNDDTWLLRRLAEYVERHDEPSWQQPPA